MNTHSKIVNAARVASVFPTILMIVALLLQAPMIGHAANTQPPPDGVVYPTGVFPDDVNNVQNAVNAGGTVLLKATNTSGQLTAFNFGPNGPTSPARRRVLVYLYDVTVLGETVGGQMTTIRGGSTPFVLTARPGTTPVQSAFRGIHFDSPRSAAFFVVLSNGFEVSGCWIHDVVGALSFGPTGPTKGQGVWVLESAPNSISGKIIIANNLVQNVHAQVGYGFVLLGYDAETEITGNVVTGVNSTGIEVLVNSKLTRIEGNVVEAGPEIDPTGSFGEGIGINYPQPGGIFYVAKNLVSCVNPQADGIYSLGGDPFLPVTDSVIEKNDVKMQDSLFGGITFFDAASNNAVLENNVSGSGAWALGAATIFDPNGIESNNLFVGNNISLFQSSLADSFFDVNSRNNVLKGNSGTVLDFGNGNQINGFTFKGMGDQQRQAQQARQQAKAQQHRKLLAAEASAQIEDDSNSGQ